MKQEDPPYRRIKSYGNVVTRAGHLRPAKFFIRGKDYILDSVVINKPLDSDGVGKISILEAYNYLFLLEEG